MVPFDLNVEMQNGIIMNFFAKKYCQWAGLSAGSNQTRAQLVKSSSGHAVFCIAVCILL